MAGKTETVSGGGRREEEGLLGQSAKEEGKGAIAAGW
jgi:hypothetical protein